MKQIYNFSAGPSVLPKPVLLKAKEELLDWHGSGVSVMEMSHRGKEFVSIAEKAERDLRRLLSIPSNYRVIFLQGGATSQFAMVPMNLLRGNAKANYVHTGAWSEKAINEAEKYCQVNIAATSAADGFKSIPDVNAWKVDYEAAYLHYTSNETIGGVEFGAIPEIDEMLLVSDMSSNILSRPLDVTQFGLIYAGAQKNMGPAGITLVIVREDLLGHCLPAAPSMYDLAAHVESHSMLNTPPTFNWYLVGLVLEWLLECGGVEAIAASNQRKANKLYGYIDESDFYSNPVEPLVRSRMNVPFLLADQSLESKFLKESAAEGLIALKGHRSVGGMRASIYNAMPESGVDALISFMIGFEQRYG